MEKVSDAVHDDYIALCESCYDDHYHRCASLSLLTSAVTKLLSYRDTELLSKVS